MKGEGRVRAKGSYVDLLYRIATGWLGWSPRDAWHTPIPEILLAKEGRIEWLKATNPFGGGGSSEPQPEPDSRGRTQETASDDALLKAFGQFGLMVTHE